MNPNVAKAAAKAEALARSKAAPANQVTLRAPQVYEAPQIHVPRNLHETALIIKTELDKIQVAQSELLSLLQEVRGEIEGQEVVVWNKPIQVKAGGAAITLNNPNPAGEANYLRFMQNGDYTGLVGHGSNNNTLSFYNHKTGASLDLRDTGAPVLWNGYTPGFAERACIGFRYEQALVVEGYGVQSPQGSTAVIPPTAKRLYAGEIITAYPQFIMTRPEDVGGAAGYGTDANNAPVNAVIFCYYNGYVQNAPPVNGTLLTLGSLNDNYCLQIMGDYSGNSLWYRNKNGDSATWHGWNKVANATTTTRIRRRMGRVTKGLRTELQQLREKIAEMDRRLNAAGIKDIQN